MPVKVKIQHIQAVWETTTVWATVTEAQAELLRDYDFDLAEKIIQAALSDGLATVEQGDTVEGIDSEILIDGRSPTSSDEDEIRAERDRLVDILDACGGRNIEVAEQIDKLNRELGEEEED